MGKHKISYKSSFLFLLFTQFTLIGPIAYSKENEDSINVLFTIDKWASITVSEVLKFTVTSEDPNMFGITDNEYHPYNSLHQSVDLSIQTNYNITLKCPSTVILTNENGSYTCLVRVQYKVAGEGFELVGSYRCMDVDPPGIPAAPGDPAVDLDIYLNKPEGWTGADLAGTYTGDILFQIVDRT